MPSTTYSQISISQSDGDPSTWPQNTTKQLNADGSFEYYRRVMAGEPKDVLWRSKTANALVEKYTPPGRPVPASKAGGFIFNALPRHYQLFEHVKGKPDGTVRTDSYCFGHPSGRRFRSPNEFIAHIYHLASKAPEMAGPAATENKTCSCALCTSDGKRGHGGGTPAASRKTARAPTAHEDRAAAQREAAADERLGEQEMAGWILRKGELVWIWLPADGVMEADAEPDGDGDDGEGEWAVGVVSARPAVNTPIRKPPRVRKSGFDDIEMDEEAPWEQTAATDDKTYRIQLLAPPLPGTKASSSPGDVRAQVPQHFLRPWLSRPEHGIPDEAEHESVAPARNVAQSFMLFEKTPHPHSTPERQLCKWGGIILGAEKIFLGEPVRIRNPSAPGGSDGAPSGSVSPVVAGGEDVLVISSIYTATTPSATKASGTNTVTYFTGSVYTTAPEPSAADITPEIFAALPFRMRRSDGYGNLLRWRIRNNTATERGELSLRMILGRWYEPVGQLEWTKGLHPLGRARIRRWDINRSRALGWTDFDGLEVIADEDRRKPPKAELAGPWAGDLPDDVDMDMDVDADADVREAVPRNTPERDFKSVNASRSAVRTTPTAARSKMALAVEDDEDEEEEGDAGDDDDGEDEAEAGTDDDELMGGMDHGKNGGGKADHGKNGGGKAVFDSDDDEGPLAKSPTRRGQFARFPARG